MQELEPKKIQEDLSYFKAEEKSDVLHQNSEVARLRIGTLNCQSVRNKIAEVVQHLQANDVDICMLQETFLTDNDGALLKEINEFGINVSSFPRCDGRQHGGLGFLSNTEINLKQYRIGRCHEWKTFEHCIMALKYHNCQILLCNLYRPPYSEKHPHTVHQFLKEFEDFLKANILKAGYMIIAGDFNLHIEKCEDSCTKVFNDLLNQFDMHQLVSPTSKTHVYGGVLDLIIVPKNFPYDVMGVKVLDHGTSSDHFLVHIDFCCSVSNGLIDANGTLDVTYRNYKDLNQIQFKSDVQSLEHEYMQVNHNSIDESVKMYNDGLKKILNNHCPLRHKNLEGKRHKSTWFDKEVKSSVRKCRMAERKWRKSHTEQDKLNYKAAQKTILVYGQGEKNNLSY